MSILVRILQDIFCRTEIVDRFGGADLSTGLVVEDTNHGGLGKKKRLSGAIDNDAHYL
jgi:hypothetical protein